MNLPMAWEITLGDVFIFISAPEALGNVLGHKDMGNLRLL